MNIPRILELAEHIEAQAHVPANSPGLLHGFNQSVYYFNCGTPACIAGHAEALWRETDGNRSNISISNFLEEALELTFREMDTLVYPPVEDWTAITPTSAARALRNLAEGASDIWVHEKQ